MTGSPDRERRRKTLRSVVRFAVGFLLLLGGCVGWNESGLWRAERGVHRMVRPGMTLAEAEAAMRARGIEPYRPFGSRSGVAGPIEEAAARLRPPPERREETLYGCLRDVQHIYIGTVSLHFLVWMDAGGRVREVTTYTTSVCL